MSSASLPPAIAGFLIDNISFEAVYFIMAGLFGSGIVFNAMLPGLHNRR